MVITDDPTMTTYPDGSGSPGGRLPDGPGRTGGTDARVVVLSPGSVLCERCGTVMEGGTEKDRILWRLNHTCQPAAPEEPCTVCGGDCGPIFCWDEGYDR